MNERVMQFRVGVMVLATAIIAGILIVLFGDLPSLVQATYPLQMKFDNARGVAEGTPVLKNGILVGRVASVSLDELGGVSVIAAIDSYVPIYHDESPRIKTTLLGDAEISLVPGRIVPPRVRLGPDDVLTGAVSRDPFEVFSDLEPKLGLALDSLVSASSTVSRLADDIDRIMVDDGKRIGEMMDKTERALDGFSIAMTNVNDIMGDAEARQNLKNSINALPTVLDDLRGAVSGISSTIDSADRNLRNLEGLTKPLGDQGEAMVSRLNGTIGRLDEVLSQVAGFAKALNDSDGTLGRLVKDPGVYEDLSVAATNVKRLTQELRPIVNDVRVFTDKIARHPEQLGVRGALDRGMGVK
jgi:phospholipid/cholesterol/gamma-HCH transport system substrate-binding protein